MEVTRMPPARILERERTAILSSLAAGVVPRLGLQHIQVGRKAEVAAMLQDILKIEAGGASIRFVVGKFGAGKSFFLSVIQNVALERKLVVARADITTERRLHSTGGHARGLYSALMGNLSTKGKPENAITSIVERFIGDLSHRITSSGGTEADVSKEMERLCAPLQELVSGYDFVKVLTTYQRGHAEQSPALQASALRWLRAEYPTKTEARQDLGVRSIIDDEQVYDYLKLFARFTRIAGYNGLLVCLDELVVLSHRLQNKIARNNNYEAILRIVNDCLQGSVEGLGFIFAATEDCLEDKRRGLFSYEALANRLAANQFASAEDIDLMGPVLKLNSMTNEERVVLLHNLRRVHAGETSTELISDQGIEAFLAHCASRMGASFFQTPRETVKGFLGLLNVLQQNPGTDWQTKISSIETTAGPLLDPSETAYANSSDADDDLATLKL
jgi:hypothetical protein